MAERVPEPFRVDWLQQVVHRVHRERPQRVLVVGGDEDHDGNLARVEFLDHLEPVEHGHLHVEQHEVRPEPPDRLDRLPPVEARAGDLDVRLAGQQRPQPVDRQRLVVHQEQAHQTASLGAGLAAASLGARRTGSTTVATNPPPARAPHSSLAVSP